MAEAVRRARARTAVVAGVRIEQGALPDAVPVETVDLAIFSEVLYYLDDATVSATLDRTLAALEPGGDVALVLSGGLPTRIQTRLVIIISAINGPPISPEGGGRASISSGSR